MASSRLKTVISERKKRKRKLENAISKDFFQGRTICREIFDRERLISGSGIGNLHILFAWQEILATFHLRIVIDYMIASSKFGETSRKSCRLSREILKQMSVMAQADSRTVTDTRQECVEKSKCRSIHALVMNHQSGNPCGKGLVQFAEKGIPAGIGAAFFTGMQIDVGWQIRQFGE